MRCACRLSALSLGVAIVVGGCSVATGSIDPQGDPGRDVPGDADAMPGDLLPETSGEVPDVVPEVGDDEGEPGSDGGDEAGSADLPDAGPASLGGTVVVMGWPPLPEARLSLDGAEPVAPGADGTFRFEGLASGLHELRAWAGEGSATELSLDLPPGEDLDLGEIVVGPGRRIGPGVEGRGLFSLAGTHQALYSVEGRNGVWDGDLHQAFPLPGGASTLYADVTASPTGRVRLIPGSGTAGQSVVAWLPADRRAVVVSEDAYGTEFVFDRAERRLAGWLSRGYAQSLVLVDLETGVRAEIPGMYGIPRFTADGGGLLYCGAGEAGYPGSLTLRDVATGIDRLLYPGCFDLQPLAPRADGALRVVFQTTYPGSSPLADLCWWEEGMETARILGASVSSYQFAPDRDAVSLVAGAWMDPQGTPMGGDLEAWEAGSPQDPVTVATDASGLSWWLRGGRAIAGLQGIHTPIGQGPRSVLVVSDLDDGSRVEIAPDVIPDDVQVAPDGNSLATLAAVQGDPYAPWTQGDLWTWSAGQPAARLVSKGVARASHAFTPDGGHLLFLGGEGAGDWDAFVQAGRWRVLDLASGDARDLGRRCVRAWPTDPTGRWAVGACDLDPTGATGVLRMVDLGTGEAVTLGPWQDIRQQWEKAAPAGFSADGATLWWATPVDGAPSTSVLHLLDLSDGTVAGIPLDLPGTVWSSGDGGLFLPGGAFAWLGSPESDYSGTWTLRWADARTGEVRLLGEGVQSVQATDVSPDGRTFRFFGDFMGVRGNWWHADLASGAAVQVTQYTQFPDAWWSPAWDRVLGLSIGAFEGDGPLTAWTAAEPTLRELDASVAQGRVAPDGDLRRAAWMAVKPGVSKFGGTLRVGGLEPSLPVASLDRAVGTGMAWAGSDLVYGVTSADPYREGVYVVTVPDAATAAPHGP